MNSTLRAVFFSVLIAGIAGAQTRRPMTPDDVMSLKTPGNARISPDGRTVVYALSFTDLSSNENRSEIWIASAAGEAPRRFSSGKNDRAPQWSPDGKSIAFLSSRGDGNGADNIAQIYVIPLAGGEADKLTSSRTSVSAFVWSPDSKQIAYIAQAPLSDEEERQRKNKNDTEVVDQNFRFTILYTADVASKKVRELVHDDVVISEPEWSPDGRRIAYTARPTPKADDGSLSDIYIVASDGSGSPKKLLENAGPDSELRWSPDGRSIAFNTRAKAGPLGFEKLSVIPADGGTPRAIAPAFDGEASNITWSKDGSTIYFQSGVKSTSQIFSVAASGGTPKQITTQEGVISGFSLSSNGTLAFAKSDLQNPTEIFRASLPNADPVRLTDHNPQMKGIATGKGEVVKWKSSDGMEIEGVLIYPVDYTPGKKVPVLANIHGGPSGVWSQSFPGSWSNYAHVWAGKGWAVFMPNVRGSSNYGEKFLLSNVRDWGGGDYRDVQTGLDDLVQRGIADPERLGQTGWSYGGYMTAWTLTQTNRFKAVMVGAGLTNMFSMYSTNDLQRVLEGYFGDTPFNDTEAYSRASAMTFIKQAKTPAMIMHGAADTRVPPSQAQELYMGLKKNNVPTEMVLFPREPHGLGEGRHRLDKMQREYAWFSKHVLGKEDRFGPVSDRDAVLHVANRTFEYLAAHDGEKMKSLFWPEAWVASDRPNAQGIRQQNIQKAEEFFKGVSAGASNPAPIKEEFVGEPEVRIDDNIATIWSKYVFTRGTDYVADGIDAFHLVKRNGEWRILSLIYTHNPRK